VFLFRVSFFLKSKIGFKKGKAIQKNAHYWKSDLHTKSKKSIFIKINKATFLIYYYKSGNMKPSEDLHQLIKHMSMSEKRYFKIYSTRHVIGYNNNYIHLFDAIDKQNEYDEERIKKYFGKETFVKHLPSEKHYLYNLILDGLNAYHKDRTFLTRYSNLLMNIEILYNKGLFEQCRKLIQKAKKEAYLLEKFSILFLIIRWETLVYIKDEDVKGLYKSFDEELRILEVIRIQSALMRIAFNIQIQIYKGKITTAFLKSQEEEIKKYYPPKKEVNSFWARYYYYSGMGLIYSVQRKYGECYDCFREINVLMQNTKQFIVDLPHIYHTNHNNMINLLFALKKHDEILPIITHQRAFTTIYRIKNTALNQKVFLNTSESELYLYYKTEEYEKGILTIKRIEPELKKINIKFSPSLIDLYFMISVICLENQDYKGAIKWLNKILNHEKDVNIRRELQINTRLLYLIVLLEKEDLFFDNQYQSVKRFLVNEKEFKKQVYLLEIIKLLSEQRLNPTKIKLLKDLIKKSKTENQKVIQESLNPQYDFMQWIENQLLHKKIK